MDRLSAVALLGIAACVATLPGGAAHAFWPFSSGPERTEYNVWFVFPRDPGEREQPHRFLGRVVGLDACQSTARSYAQQTGVIRSTRWSYYCCSRRNNSECFERVR